ncbi:hypothetical protein A2U01_0080814, partial [Trifolium medium]|nr:hypothetical protein [Trifolium medium]
MASRFEIETTKIVKEEEEVNEYEECPIKQVELTVPKTD